VRTTLVWNNARVVSVMFNQNLERSYRGSLRANVDRRPTPHDGRLAMYDDGQCLVKLNMYNKQLIETSANRDVSMLSFGKVNTL